MKLKSHYRCSFFLIGVFIASEVQYRDFVHFGQEWQRRVKVSKFLALPMTVVAVFLFEMVWNTNIVVDGVVICHVMVVKIATEVI